jgi:hypothetical protein
MTVGREARMRTYRNPSAHVRWRALLARTGFIAMLAASGPDTAIGQTKPAGEARPAVGGVVSLPDALLIYPAEGAAGACGENCTHWLAVEGTVHWDGHTRLIAALDRFSGKAPIFLNVRGQSDLKAAMSIGRLLRERGYDDVSVGRTVVDQCRGVNDSDCVALKRSGVPLPASLSSIDTCDLTCVVMLAGGARRTLPEDTTVLIDSTRIRNRLGLNIADEAREGLHEYFRDRFRRYFEQMGIDPTLADMIEANYGTARATRLSRADMVRLRIVAGQ